MKVKLLSRVKLNFEEVRYRSKIYDMTKSGYIMFFSQWDLSHKSRIIVSNDKKNWCVLDGSHRSVMGGEKICYNMSEIFYKYVALEFSKIIRAGRFINKNPEVLKVIRKG